MLSRVFNFGRNWDVFPSFVSRHLKVSLSSRSDSRAYFNLPQSHIKAQTYFTSLSSSFTINLFAKNHRMLTHFLNHEVMSSTGTLQPRPSKGILQPRFSKLSKFENLSVKMISHSWGHSNPDLLGDTPTPLLKNSQDLKIFLCQKNYFPFTGILQPYLSTTN